VTISVDATLDFLSSRHMSALDKIKTVQRLMVWKECDASSNKLGIISD